MGSAAYAELGTELEARGLRYVNTDVPTGVAYGDGRALVAARDPQVTVRGLRPRGRRPRSSASSTGSARWPTRSGRCCPASCTRRGRRPTAEARSPPGRARRAGGRGLRRAERARLAARHVQGPEPGLLYAALGPAHGPGAVRGRRRAAARRARRAACTSAACRSWRAGSRASSRRSSGSSPTTAARCAPAPTSSASRCPTGARPASSPGASGSRRGARSSRASRRRSSTAGCWTARGRTGWTRRPPGRAVPLRPRRDADPPRAVRAAALERRPARRRRRRARAGRDGRRRARLRAGVAGSAAEQPDGRRRPAVHRGPVTRPGGQRHPVDSAAGGALRTDGGRRGGARRRAGGWTPELADALRRPRASRASPSTRRTCPARCSAGRSSPRPTSRRATSTSTAATRTAALDASRPGAAVAAAGRPPARTARAVDALWHIGASTHPGPGLNAASGRMVAQRLIAGEPGWRGALGRLRR